MSNYKIQSSTFLPESIRDYDFYSRLTEILDYVLDLYHTQNIDILKALYDIRDSNFDPEACMRLLGANEFIEFAADTEQFRTLCILLSNLYEIKGTQRGIKYLLRLLDMDCTIYEWYDINKWAQQGDPSWQEVPPCSIVLELGFEHRPIGVCDKYDKWALPRTGAPGEEILGENQAFEDTEGKFQDFAKRLLWVCVTLNEIRWMKSFTDYVDISEKFAWESVEVFYDKYSPYAMNCPGTLQVGYPVYQTYPYVGDPITVGSFEYEGFPFLVRSLSEYNDPINYEGWNNSGFVGYSHQAYRDEPFLVGTPLLTVGESAPFWEWGYSVSGGDDYLLWQRAVVGGRFVESDISPQGCWHVSGCQVSYIHSWTETRFESDVVTRRGIIVGDENFVQPPDNIGDSHVVDTQQGDILGIVPEQGLSDSVTPTQVISFQKEVGYESHIRDLYEPFLVGDPTKFVGDTNLRVGTDYFFTWFETGKEIDFEERFFTSCLQVGSWGHAFFPETSYELLVGVGTVGVTHFVGENTTPSQDISRNPLLYVGTSLLVGSQHVVSPSIKVGAGFNYVGEIAPWDGTGFVSIQNNIIYEVVESQLDSSLFTEVSSEDSVTTDMSGFELGSNIRDSLWNKLVGAAPHVGYEDPFQVGYESALLVGETSVGSLDTVGSSEFFGEGSVGSSPVVGYSQYDGSDWVDSDPYCVLRHDVAIEIGSERFLFETPIVGDQSVAGYIGFVPVTVGSVTQLPILVGEVTAGYHVVVGQWEEIISEGIHFVGDGLSVGAATYVNTTDTYVGVSAQGILATPQDTVIHSRFGTEAHENFTTGVDTLDHVDPEQSQGFTSYVFESKNLVGNGLVEALVTVQPGYVVGSETVGTFTVGSGAGLLVGAPDLIGATEVVVARDDISEMSAWQSETVSERICGNVPIVGSGITPDVVVSPDTVAESFPLNLLLVGSGTVGGCLEPHSVGTSSFLTCYIEEGEDLSFSFVGDFSASDTSQNVTGTEFVDVFEPNQGFVPEVIFSENGDVLILNPEGADINPVYLAGEGLVPAENYPTFNFTNDYHDALTYLIEDS